MSCHMIYMKDGKKMMMPVLTKEEYLAYRNGGEQRERVRRIRQGEVALKSKLAQMNYSCLPNEDGTLKGSTRMSNTVGMDIDHIPAEELQAVKERILSKKEELGLLMLEESARGEGLHLVFKRHADLDQEGNLKWASELLGVAYDAQAKDITRVFFTTTGSQLIFLSEELFRPVSSEETTEFKIQNSNFKKEENNSQFSTLPLRSRVPLATPSAFKNQDISPSPVGEGRGEAFPTSYHGIPFTDIIRKYWELNNHGFEPTQGDRDTLTYQLACDLRHICGKNFDWLDQVIPCYDGFPLEEKRAKIKSALASEYNGFPIRLKNVLNALQMEDGRGKMEDADQASDIEEDDAAANSSFFTLHSSFKKLPQGIRESIDAVGPSLSMPAVVAICPAIGMLATGVRLDVHGKKNGLNLISYIAGDFASGKGSIDPVIDAWLGEVRAVDMMYEQQEEEWRAKKNAAKNKKEQPEELKLPVRFITLNSTVAKLSERLANAEGKHAFSFTPEADTVAQKWKSAMSDFSVMLRQSYDGSKYEREAKSSDSVNVHIEQLLWNVTMCGTPDALYRVVTNYTDGFLSRIAIARTPDNTFAPLEDKPHVLTDRQTERIQQIAHLLPLMQGTVELPKLEQKGREWLEQIRLETMKNDDRVKARQRLRTCVTAQRMTCCIMLCRVAEQLIQKHGMNGAEKVLKSNPELWKTMLQKAQTPQLLDIYDAIADYLMETALFFFRDRIEAALQSRDYSGRNDRQRMGRNDSIYERLDVEFVFESAFQHSVGVKGASVSRNSVRQMLKNWKKQGLIVQTEAGRYRKVCH